MLPVPVIFPPPVQPRKRVATMEPRVALHSNAELSTSTSMRTEPIDNLGICQYLSEEQLSIIKGLVETELSEPYSVYTYRYFLNNWPHLCFIAKIGVDKFDGSDVNNEPAGAIVCKLDRHKSGLMRGYIAMLVVEARYRKRGIAKRLVSRALEAMLEEGADEVVLETEVTNAGAISLYESLGFIRAKRLHKYYLNGVDAYRLKLCTKVQMVPDKVVLDNVNLEYASEEMGVVG